VAGTSYKKNTILVNTPPAKAGGFGLRLKAGSIGHAADYPLSLWEDLGEGEGESDYT